MKASRLHASAASYFVLQILLLHAASTAATRPSHYHKERNHRPSAMDFFKKFQGSKKGDTVEGIHQLKKYLQSLGYISPDKTDDVRSNHFDGTLESAVKAYQTMFKLNPTGTLDPKTIDQMSRPRCGNLDFEAGTNINNYTTQYAFLRGEPKWPLTTDTLTYAFAPGTPSNAQNAIRDAFTSWSIPGPFQFQVTDDFNRANLKISFLRGDHGDGHPFDGPRGILAHAFAPTDGRLHFDADEHWVVGAVFLGQDLTTVALHEIGHLLGLAHSADENAIMWPYMETGITRGLNNDDITAIRALYGISE